MYRGVTVASLTMLLSACDPETPGASSWDPALATLSGEALAARFCQGCHVLPPPEVLDRQTWATQVLPRMGHRLGIYSRSGLREDSLLETGLAGEYVHQAGIFPDSPLMPPAAWQKLVGYYVRNAPEKLPAPPSVPPVGPRLDRFRVRIPEFRSTPPMTSLVAIDSVGGRIFLGDTKRDFSTLEIFDGRGNPIQTLGMESAPSHVRIRPDSVEVLLMGKVLPTDEPAGIFRTMFRSSGEANYTGSIRLLDGLFRPVHVSYADLTGDGEEDLVISEFGNLIGRLAWYEWRGPANYQMHELRSLPGTIGTRLRDADADGDLDVIALTAQGDEGIYLYRNQGNGRFQEVPLVRFPPWYGSSGFEVVDFNRDGHFDLLHTSGDNGDYRPVAKPYHGVRLFLNDGMNRFEERYFYPLFGAFGVQARDFDGDGDLDIAAIAFYPEYRRPPVQSFVYLENRGAMKFSASTFAEQGQGRWITFAAGDVDRDGDADLVLGSFVAFDPIGDTTGLYQRWLNTGPSMVILENRTR